MTMAAAVRVLAAAALLLVACGLAGAKIDVAATYTKAVVEMAAAQR